MIKMKKLLNLFRKNKEVKEQYMLLQWGKNNSIIKEVNNNKIYIVDNNYLMNLDEMGVIL